jgi:uncharacterized repeat protein (TIGR03803 family)
MPDRSMVFHGARPVVVCAIAVFAAMPPPAQAQTTEVVMHDFGSPPNGARPVSGVTRDKAGNFYGTTLDGGPANLGVVFKVDLAGRITVLHGFTGGSDGALKRIGNTKGHGEAK